MNKLLLFLVLSSISSITIAGTCQVEITYHHKTGFTDQKVFEVKSPSKADCEKKRELYKVNTAPKKLKSKEVKIKWLG